MDTPRVLLQVLLLDGAVRPVASQEQIVALYLVLSFHLELLLLEVYIRYHPIELKVNLVLVVYVGTLVEPLLDEVLQGNFAGLVNSNPPR